MLPKHPFQYYATISACLHKVSPSKLLYIRITNSVLVIQLFPFQHLLPAHPLSAHLSVCALCLHTCLHTLFLHTFLSAHPLSTHPLSAHLSVCALSVCTPSVCTPSVCTPSICLSHPFQCNFINPYSSDVSHTMIFRRTPLLGVGCCILVGLLVSLSNLRCSQILRSVGWHFNIDVSGQPICPIFKGKSFQEGCLKMRPIGSPETSVTCYIPVYAA